jgi:hypothetical protein
MTQRADPNNSPLAQISQTSLNLAPFRAATFPKYDTSSIEVERNILRSDCRAAGPTIDLIQASRLVPRKKNKDLWINT